MLGPHQGRTVLAQTESRLFVQVFAADGSPVTDLVAEDFVIEQDGVEGRVIRAEIVEEPLQSPSERAPGRAIPAGLESICQRALEKDPAERFQSMRELIQAIREFRTRAMLSSEQTD